MDRPENCSGCKHYKSGLCTDNYFRKTRRDPDEVCAKWEHRSRLDDILEWFEALPEYKSWLILRFAICISAAITLVVAIVAFIFLLSTIVCAFTLDPIGFASLLVSALLIFLTWCGLGVIKRLWNYMEEVF